MTVAQQLAELRDLSVAELVVRYEELFDKPPRSRHRAWLWKRIGWRLQEREFGGLSGAAKRRIAELQAEIRMPELDCSEPRRSARASGLKVGSVLTREWRGTTYRVTVLPSGFEHEGRTFRSLSALAKHISGQHTSGRRFFRLAPETKL